MLGRLDDARVKGLDIALRAVAKALDWLGADENEYEVLLRGAPVTGHDLLREKLLEMCDRSLRMVTKSFSIDQTTLHDDLRRATLMLLPSRAEAFGLAAAEAIAAGTPVLISNRSGLGMLLREPGLLSGEESRRIVVPIVDVLETDTETWARAVQRVLADPGAAFANAAKLQAVLAEHRTWAMAADVVLKAIGHRAAGQRPGSADLTCPASAPPPRAARRFSGPARLAFQRGLGPDWRDLADLLEIPRYDQQGFERGHEASDLWDWLDRRRRLSKLPPALRIVGRSDLADGLDGTDVPPCDIEGDHDD